MNTELLTTLVPIVVIGFIGLLAGGFIGALIAGGMRDTREASTKTRLKNHIHILSLWRDHRNGKILVEMEGEYFPTFEKLAGKPKTKFLQNLDELQLWAGAENLASRIESAPITPEPLEKPLEKPLEEPLEKPLAIPLEKPLAIPLAIPLSSTESKPAFTTIPTPLTIEQTGLPTVKPPSMNVSDIIVRAITPEFKGKVPDAPKSIAAQVDEILQEKLPQTPLRERSIRLLEIPGRGLVVMVDGQAYEGVSDVPDEEVRHLIKLCVSEWEKIR